MKTEKRLELKAKRNPKPVFEGLQIVAELTETLAVTTITQTYRNSGVKNIEALYTFPLPLDAVLLEMTVLLGGKLITGKVLPKQVAEDRYEEAIVDGDAPIMLQNPEPGIYTMNVGNLLPGESATITLRYGMFMKWQDRTLRYFLPTTIAPRFGSPAAAGLDTYQEPETSIFTDNLYSFEMTVKGTIAGSLIESPSHGILVERNISGDSYRVRLGANTAFMDRDLVITLTRDQQMNSFSLLIPDGEEHLLWCSFQPRFMFHENHAPRSIKILVDCSGSMAGDSIEQAKVALLRILDELRPQDWFNIIAFGSSSRSLFNAQVKANPESVAYARGYLQKLDADMGGTEIYNAIIMALGLKCPEDIAQNVLLITDGEVCEWEKIVNMAQQRAHRFFTVGVGSAVSEPFVRKLAEDTGGASELVSPNENMAEKIHRHFNRIDSPCTKMVETIWPDKPKRTLMQKRKELYDGDTCNIFAWFDLKQSGETRVVMSLPQDEITDITIETKELVTGRNDLPRMVAALRLKENIGKRDGEALAMKYQLASPWTNYLAIAQRNPNEQADTLPELCKVKQMYAAGHAGSGTVKGFSYTEDFILDDFLKPEPQPVRPAPSGRTTRAAMAPDNDTGRAYLRDPEPCRIMPSPRQQKPPKSARTVGGCCYFHAADDDCNLGAGSIFTGKYFKEKFTRWLWYDEESENLKRFCQQLSIAMESGAFPVTINIPDIPEKIRCILEELVASGIDEETVMLFFLMFFEKNSSMQWLSMTASEFIRKSVKNRVKRVESGSEYVKWLEIEEKIQSALQLK